MNKTPVTFAQYVHDRLAGYRIWTSAITSVLIALVFGILSIFAQAKFDRKVISSFAPYVATLLESGDSIETQRLISSADEGGETQFTVVKNGLIVASTRSLEEIGQSYRESPSRFESMGVVFFGGNILSEVQAARTGGSGAVGRIISFTSARGPILLAVWTALAAFLGCLILLYFSARRTRNAIRDALRPIEALHLDILALGLGGPQPLTGEIPILELDTIRKTIGTARRDLANTQDRLAEERASAISGETLKRVIHDLHNPISALRQMASVSQDQGLSEEDRKEARDGVLRLGEQILTQISSVKQNLAENPITLEERDLRPLLKETLAEMISAKGGDTQSRIRLFLPEEPVISAVDGILLKRALLNLVDNGIAASRTRVELALIQDALGAKIRVSDDGNGIRSEDLTIFMQGRGKSSNADRPAYGLSSANHIVKAHGGRIIYKKSEFGGAEFEIRLGVSI
jgi:signal transduction histidine kinase